MAKYIGVADVAKLLRKALKESFPGVKFSVRSKSYSGGSSISVSYVDGPSVGLVESVAKMFEGAYFDGMIDYKGSVNHRLNGEDVRLLCDFVFVSREYSDELRGKVGKRALKKYAGMDVDASDAEAGSMFHYGGIYDYCQANGLSHDITGWIEGEFSARLMKSSDRLSAASSATLAALAISGDDGYGAGTMGNASNGWHGESAYRAMNAAH